MNARCCNRFLPGFRLTSPDGHTTVAPADTRVVDNLVAISDYNDLLGWKVAKVCASCGADRPVGGAW